MLGRVDVEKNMCYVNIGLICHIVIDELLYKQTGSYGRASQEYLEEVLRALRVEETKKGHDKLGEIGMDFLGGKEYYRTSRALKKKLTEGKFSVRNISDLRGMLERILNSENSKKDIRNALGWFGELAKECIVRAEFENPDYINAMMAHGAARQLAGTLKRKS